MIPEIAMIADVWVKLLGVWILCDGVYSLLVWLPKRQSWLRDHSIRIIRILIGILMILFG